MEPLPDGYLPLHPQRHQQALPLSLAMDPNDLRLRDKGGGRGGATEAHNKAESGQVVPYRRGQGVNTQGQQLDTGVVHKKKGHRKKGQQL